MNTSTDVPDAETVVAAQLEAYNAGDIDALMAMWHDDAQYFAHPKTLLANGAAEIRERHITRFKEPDLFGRLLARFSVGTMVVDREIVTRNLPEGRAQVDVIAIYDVEAGRIRNAWFRQGAPVIAPAE